jgi:hypothetical protein
MRTCDKCYKNPVRVRNGKDLPGELSFCMSCAEESNYLLDGDSPPEPEGFVEFLKLVIGGSPCRG